MPLTCPPSLLQTWQQFAQEHFPALCQARDPLSHKGSFGTLGILGGSVGMSGSIILAGQAALMQGAGKVWLGFAQPYLPLPVLQNAPEIMLATASDLLQRQDITAWVIGCGLSLKEEAFALLKQCLTQHTALPLVMDADALNLLAQNPTTLTPLLSKRPMPAILTPHAAEAGRLLNCSAEQIMNQRQISAQTLAQRYESWVVLKGHRTIVCSPMGHLFINTSGNAGLATAGSGDTLSGLIGSLLAQKLPLDQAVKAGVWLHGVAADLLVLNQEGPIGLRASELPYVARFIRNQLTF